jgi:hypothetical protein
VDELIDQCRADPNRVLADDEVGLVVYVGAGLQMFFGAVIHHGPKKRSIGTFGACRPAVFPRFQIFSDEPQNHRMDGHKGDFASLTLDSEVR